MRSPRLYETRSMVLEMLSRLARDLCAKVYLFGSYARGDHTLESDVDVVVVSDAFRGLPLQDRVAIVRARLPLDLGFDIIPLTPEEFRERLSRAFFREASRYWVEVGGEPQGSCRPSQPRPGLKQA